MPIDKSIKKVLVIGSGPIVIGQAAEFDYAGTQACRALKENGIEVVLVNSNPATIMTDKEMADRVYLEPLRADVLKNIIDMEKPDSILPTLGGQTGLNLACELAESGFLKRRNVRLLGTNLEAIKKAEDRELFKETMIAIGEPTIESAIINNVSDAVLFAKEEGYPLIIRPGYTLGGTGGGFANNIEELKEIVGSGIKASRVGQVLLEKSVAGWKEIEFEVMRDTAGKAIIICDMENIDPVGIHTGDSIVVAPCQTITPEQLAMLKNASIKIINELGIIGGCNIQYALSQTTNQYFLIEVNPRVSRSSALASKATGYPIARVSALLAIGYNLEEIINKKTNKPFAHKEPKVEYFVCKFPRWPFDKFTQANKLLGTRMKATGEVMSIGSNFEQAFLKAIRSLELNIFGTSLAKYSKMNDEEILACVGIKNDERMFAVLQALSRGISVKIINEITSITPMFLQKMQNITKLENEFRNLGKKALTKESLLKAKKIGFADKEIAKLVKSTEAEIREMRKKFAILPNYSLIDIAGDDKILASPYYYSQYEHAGKPNDAKGNTVVVLGSGPIRIGQGVEFDYCSVHSVWALKKAGYNTVIINNNPETVSTDYDTADKLYFEPLTTEEVLNILDIEKPVGVVVQFGGQTAIKLTKSVADAGYKILGTQPVDIDAAEDREMFDELLTKLNLARPKGETVFTTEEAIKVGERLGYPVLVRPSYVLGGQGMEIAYNETDIIEYMNIVTAVEQEHPILIDKYIMGMELEVDAICDGTDILIPGIMEHVERTGVHSGDSISVYPPLHISGQKTQEIIEVTKKLALALNTKGLINIQYIIANNELYLIEVNPRSSRTVPFISKVTNIPMVQLAIRCVLGESLKDMGYGTDLYKRSSVYAVKVPVFSNEKLPDLEISASPEMKSTGEVLGISDNYSEALLKALIASGIHIESGCGVVISVSDNFKNEIVEVARSIDELGYKIFATVGTAKTLIDNDIYAIVVNKLVEKRNGDIVYLAKKGILGLIINTPTKGRQSSRDGFKIRRIAIEMGIPCITSIDTANALCKALKLNKTEKDLRPIALQDLEQ
ncbi:MAG: carbamoyl-phosphate synthase large subunit [Clostridia bacterium]